MKINKEQERGKADFGWLKANYSFSFGQYFNPNKMGFRSLLVINEDFVEPHSGFPKHGHKNMEILTFIIKGKLTHMDSLGNIKTLEPNKIQRMYAGKGINHSEFNNTDEILNLLQIWIEPNQLNLNPEYNEKEFNFNQSGEILLASPTGRMDSIKIYQNVEVSILNLNKNDAYNINSNFETYLHVIKGTAKVSGNELKYGDSVELNQENIVIHSVEDTSLLIFNFL